MGRRVESPLKRLQAEAESIELLLSDLVPLSEDVEAYWDLSIRLMTLVDELEGITGAEGSTASEPEYLRLRSALSQLEGSIIEIERRAQGLA